MQNHGSVSRLRPPIGQAGVRLASSLTASKANKRRKTNKQKNKKTKPNRQTIFSARSGASSRFVTTRPLKTQWGYSDSGTRKVLWHHGGSALQHGLHSLAAFSPSQHQVPVLKNKKTGFLAEWRQILLLNHKLHMAVVLKISTVSVKCKNNDSKIIQILVRLFQSRLLLRTSYISHCKLKRCFPWLFIHWIHTNVF